MFRLVGLFFVGMAVAASILVLLSVVGLGIPHF